MSQLKVLFITPHLSTGGAPQYLLKKISALKDSCEVYCVEYENITGGVLVVQRNQISELLKDKLITLEENKQELVSVINKIKPDVVHFEEMPEYFCDYEVASKIYVSARSYKIIETSHDSSFNINNKLFFPDRFAFVSDYQKKLFSELNIQSDVVQYPVEYKNKTDRKSSLISLGLDPDKIHFLNVGLFTPRKNQAEIVEYAKSLLDEPVQFHFVGNQADNFKSYWEPLMKDFPSNCKWWGERKDTDTFYNAMDVFLFASKGSNHDKETNPLVLKEAIGWKMPVLMYDLDVYGDYYKQFDNIKYLSDKNSNLNLLKSFIHEAVSSRFFNVSYNEDEIKISFTVTKTHPDLKTFNVRMRDAITKLVFQNIHYGLPFEKNFSIWIKPNSEKNYKNGILVEFFDDAGNIIEDITFIDSKPKSSWVPVFFPTTEIIIENKKINLQCNPLDQSSFWSYYENFISQSYKNIEAGDIVVDIGANIGFFSLFAASMGAKKIYSIEPVKETFNYLQQNTKDIPNISIFNLGVGSKTESVEFLVGDVSSICGKTNYTEIINHNWGLKNKKEIVSIINANQFFEENKISYIDYLKIDCEGAELEFFKSIDKNFLRHKIKKISGEIHLCSIGEEGYLYIADLLKDCGFSFTSDYQKNSSIVIFHSEKKPKIKLVHILNDVEGERERKSIESLKKLSSFGLDYEQFISPKFSDIPPVETCNRPQAVSQLPGDYLLSPAHYGCFLSHKNIICNNFIKDYDAIVICECDCVVYGEYKEFYEKILNTYHLNNKYDLISTSFGKQIIDSPHELLEGDLFSCRQQSETHCYLVNQIFINKYSLIFNNSKWDTIDLWGNVFLSDQRRGIYKTPSALQSPGISYLDLKFKEGVNIDARTPIFKLDSLDSDISVLIQSSDSKESFWNGWYLSFDRYWNWDLNWPIYFYSEEKSLPFNDSRINNIKLGKYNSSSDFSNRLMEILDGIKTKYVLYLQEDMWPIVPVDYELFKKSLYKIRYNNWNCLRIHEKLWHSHEFIKTSHFVKNKRILKAKNKTEWLLTHNACIWDKDFFASCIEKNEDPWKNEVYGTIRIANKYTDPKIYHLDERWYYQMNPSQKDSPNSFMKEYEFYLKCSLNLKHKFDL